MYKSEAVLNRETRIMYRQMIILKFFVIRVIANA